MITIISLFAVHMPVYLFFGVFFWLVKNMVNFFRRFLALLGSYNLLLFTIYQIQVPFCHFFYYFFFLFLEIFKNKYKTYLKCHHWFNIIFPKQKTNNNK